MKKRFALGGAVVLAGALVACGGGGGGGGGGGTPPPPPPPTPTPTPAYFNQRPSAPGDAFTFNGTMTTSRVYAYPNPTLPPTNTTTQAQQVLTVASGTNPFGAAKATDFHSVETDTAQLATTTLTGDAWYGYVPAGSGMNFVLYGINATDNAVPHPNTISYAYVAPQVVDELPEAVSSWTNGPAVTISETDANGDTETRTYNTDGSYSENASQLQSNATATIAEKADGSGSYTGNAVFGGQIYGLSFSAPSPQPSASPAITVQILAPLPPTPTPIPSASPGAPTPTPNPTSSPLQTLKVPAWYSTPPQLYSESDTGAIGVAFPGGCAVPSGYGTSGNSVVQKIDRLDTILGYTDVQTTTAYIAPGFGPVCVVMNDVQTTYYDYLNDQQFSFVFASKPQLTSTVNETLTLQTGATIQSRARRSSAGATSLTPQMFAVGRARFLRAVERERSNRVKAFHDFVKRYVVKGAAL